MTKVSKDKVLDLKAGEVLIAEHGDAQVIGKISGKPTGFFAAHRGFADQFYFMQLVAATRGDNAAPVGISTEHIELGQLKPHGKLQEPAPDITDLFADRVLQDFRKQAAFVAPVSEDDV